MEKVLITGGFGFIGKEIIKILLDKGFEVRVLDLNDAKIPGVRNFKGSVLDSEAISKAMMGCSYVIHLAAVLGVSKSTYAPVESLDVNLLGTRNVLRCCAIHKIKKIVYSSSSEVYGEPDKIPITEDTPLHPKSEYGVAKFTSEEYLKAYKKQYGLDYSIVRFFNVYGEEQRHSWVMSKFVNNAVLGKPLKVFGDGSQVRSFCHVKDCARGTVEVLLSYQTNNDVFNIGNGNEPISMKELAEKVVEIAQNGSIEIVPLEQSDRTKEREIYKRMPSTKKAKNIFGYEPQISLIQGIKMLVNYKRERIDEIKSEVQEAEEYEKKIKGE